MNEKKLSILILGAGPAGLVAALKLSQNDYEVKLIEKSKTVGGMCKSLFIEDSIVDLGPHRFFSKSQEVNELWKEFAREDLIAVNRLTRIFYRQKFYDYPLRIFSALKKLGIYTSFQCFFSILKSKICPRKVESFEDWGINNFGMKLYQIFFCDYTKKLWGIDPKELDTDFAAQRIRKMSFKNILGFNNKSRTLIDEFYYSKKGTGKIYENMKDRIISNGGKVLTESKVSEIQEFEGRYKVCINNQWEKFDQIISTIPLPDFILLFSKKTHSLIKLCQRLKFRSTILVYIVLPKDDYFKDNWIYINDEKKQIGRVTNFSNWGSLNEYSKNTILCCELWCSENDQIWNLGDDQLFKMISLELVEILFQKRFEIINYKIVRIKNSYPIYYKGYKEVITQIVEHLDQHRGIHCIGRSGSYKYNNQDHSIYMGMKVAKKIISDCNISLWDINSNYDEYLEEISK
ncbi:MAG: FAD-dependent oxidoreductase [Halobacteriovoraceae bacterium]|nr:FAD-dependent oxidoreductase [Halobacteriovoraceae bacterium]